MIPVAGLDDVRVAWMEIRKHGFVLYGFMLYSDCDTPLVSYMKAGLFELDTLSGSDCAIFVIESPSAKWMEMTKTKDHPWWHLFGERLERQRNVAVTAGSRATASMVENLTALRHVCVVQMADGSSATLEHLLDPNYNLLYDRNEVWGVAKYFGIRFEQVPCIVFFRQLTDPKVKVMDLSDLDNDVEAARFFRQFFGSQEFHKLLAEK